VILINDLLIVLTIETCMRYRINVNIVLNSGAKVDTKQGLIVQIYKSERLCL
jgi:hypothetical protein